MDILEKITNKFKILPEVEAIAVAGSSQSKAMDENSDYDICIYCKKDIPLELREDIAWELGDTTKYIEINNTFWGTCDEWVSRSEGIGIDIVYWSPDWIEKQINKVSKNFQASVGYTTCFWYTINISKILFDRSGWFADLQKKANISYPDELVKNIINHNYPILRDKQSSYYHQIEKAIKREDYVSINHRISEFLASYFDIIFAVNKQLHPGEKRLISAAIKNCKTLPADFGNQVKQLIISIFSADESILENINNLVNNLDKILPKISP